MQYANSWRRKRHKSKRLYDLLYGIYTFKPPSHIIFNCSHFTKNSFRFLFSLNQSFWIFSNTGNCFVFIQRTPLFIPLCSSLPPLPLLLLLPTALLSLFISTNFTCRPNKERTGWKKKNKNKWRVEIAVSSNSSKVMENPIAVVQEFSREVSSSLASPSYCFYLPRSSLPLTTHPSTLMVSRYYRHKSSLNSTIFKVWLKTVLIEGISRNFSPGFLLPFVYKAFSLGEVVVFVFVGSSDGRFWLWKYLTDKKNREFLQ